MKNLKSMIVLGLTFVMCLSLNAQSANLKTVADGYAKFGAGDIPGILQSLDASVVWFHDGDPAVIPFAGTYKGTAEVGRFFELVGKTTQISIFNPTNFKENGNQVTNDCHIEGIVTATGKKYADDITMTWTFDAGGKCIKWAANGAMPGLHAASK